VSSVSPWLGSSFAGVTREQVRGSVILLALALVFTAWRLWRAIAG
jgi:hypothetical protein